MDDETTLTSEEFVAEMRALDEATSPALDGYEALINLLEHQLADENEHDCPVDHTVYESLTQAKLRLAESVMWLRSAVVTKMAASGVVPVMIPSDDDLAN